MSARNRVAAWLSLAAWVVFVSGLGGCGRKGAEYQVAPVKGTITCQGQPVKDGSVTFRPLGTGTTLGKPASAEVVDGAFVLSTYGKDDGAVIGKHEVTYTYTSEAPKDYNDKPKPSPYMGLVPEPNQVEIKAGKNEINIELVKGPAKKR